MRCYYKGLFRDGSGHPILSGTVSVYLAGTTTAASVYTSLASATAVNSVTGSATDGTFELWVDRFDYDQDQQFKLTLSKAGYTSQTWDNVSVDQVVLGTYAITADKTVTTSLNVPDGVIYQIATGKTLTISGPFEAGLYQVFDCVGTGAVTLSGGVNEVYPEWWGIDGTADQVEINAAIVSVKNFHGVVRLQAKNYVIDGQILVYTGTVLTGSSFDISSGTLSTTISSAYNGYAISSATLIEQYSEHFKDFKIIVDASAGKTLVGGLDLGGVGDTTVENVVAFIVGGTSTNAAFYLSRSTFGGYYNRILNCRAMADSGSLWEYGLKMSGGTNQNVIDQFHATRSNIGVQLSGYHNTLSSSNTELITSKHIYIAAHGNNIISSPYMDSGYLYTDPSGTYTNTIGIDDIGAVGSTIINPYFAGVDTHYNSTTSFKSGIFGEVAKGKSKTIAYSASIDVDAELQNTLRIQVTDANAFMINNPTNSTSAYGLHLTYIIYNNSGGEIGLITWGNEFVLNGPFVNPRNNLYKTITFVRHGNVWVEVSRTNTDSQTSRKVIIKKAIPDNSATSIARIETINETGSTDGGAYSVFIHAVVSHGASSGSGYVAAKSFTAQFSRVINSDGSTGANSAVTEVVETSSAATDAAVRDVATVTMTLVETSTYKNDIQLLVDTTGTSATTAEITMVIEIVYTGFLTAPIITSL